MNQEQWMEERRKEIVDILTDISCDCNPYGKYLTRESAASDILTLLTTQIEAAEKRGESKILQQVGILRQLVAETDMTKDQIYKELDNICPLDPHGFIPQMAAYITNHN